MNNLGPAIRTAALNMIEAIRDRIAILRLRWQIAAEKVRRYDRMVADFHGLMQALKTKDRQIAELNRKLEEANDQFQALQDDLTRLQDREQADRDELVDHERRMLFKKLESVLAQLPSVRQAINTGADVDGRQVLDIIAPLEESMQALGFEPIGAAGAHIPFDPRQHKVVGKGARSVQETDLVRVRYVGYSYQGEILAKAEVTAALEAEKVS